LEHAAEGEVVVSVELTRREDGRLAGRVVGGDDQPVPFSGTLELISAIEAHLATTPPRLAP
jgi:hypothetical protein